MIFTAAADDDLEPIVESAFENVEQGGTLYFCMSIFLLKYSSSSKNCPKVI